MKKIIILGCTGSIGTQTLDVIRHYKEDFEVIGLSCNSNISLLQKQIEEFKPKYVAISNESIADKVDVHSAVLYKGVNSSTELCKIKVDIVVNALVGVFGLIPTIEAINNGSNIALANKETLVTGGDIVMNLAKEKNVNIFPVDSEHSAIWQCLYFDKNRKFDKIYLTASGGAFRDKTRDEIANSNAKIALKHPTWNMGAKVTIDSATLMNKGLEVIEAMHLFNTNPNNIEILIHKESVVHSMVKYQDGSVIAQLSNPDMKLPIQVALNYPNRGNYEFTPIDFTKINLSFSRPDYDRFPCLAIALRVAEKGGLCPTIMNAANEELVKFYLNDKISFYDISYYIEKALKKFDTSDMVSVDSIIALDKAVRIYITNEVENKG